VTSFSIIVDQPRNDAHSRRLCAVSPSGHATPWEPLVSGAHYTPPQPTIGAITIVFNSSDRLNLRLSYVVEAGGMPTNVLTFRMALVLCLGFSLSLNAL